jgi:hypothetical protein
MWSLGRYSSLAEISFSLLLLLLLLLVVVVLVLLYLRCAVSNWPCIC